MSFREESQQKNIGIGLDITGFCNNSCIQCYYASDYSSTKFLSLDQIKTIIRKTADKFSELYLLGGEPTLHPQLPEIIEFGSQRMNLVILVTNGLKLSDPDYCQSIAFPGLVLSMHRWAIENKAEFLVDKLSRKPGVFAQTGKAWENIERFWQGKICVQVNLLRPLVEAGHVMAVFRWAREKGYKPIIEMIKANQKFERGNNFDLSVQEVQKLYREMQDYDRRYYPEYSPEFLSPPVYGYPCTLMETSLHITVEGEIVLCVGNNTISYGNAFEGGIELALASPLRQAIQDYRNWIVGPCRDCYYFDHCHGGCRGNAKWQTGCPRASDPYCWHHAPGLSLKDMVPKTCQDCLLENHPGCGIKV